MHIPMKIAKLTMPMHSHIWLRSMCEMCALNFSLCIHNSLFLLSHCIQKSLFLFCAYLHIGICIYAHAHVCTHVSLFGSDYVFT